MTIANILARVASGELSQDQAARLIAQSQQVAPSTGGRQIKLNQSGGLCVRDPALRAWSDNKSKFYGYTLNMPLEVAKVLFGDDELLTQIKQFVGAQPAPAKA